MSRLYWTAIAIGVVALIALSVYAYWFDANPGSWVPFK